MDARLQTAVEAFRTVERRSLSLDKAQAELNKRVAVLAATDDRELLAQYERLTTQITEEYEDRREKAAASGKL